MDSKSSKCSECVRHDRVCVKRVFSDKEWNILHKEESRVDSRLRARDCDLSILQHSMDDLQRKMKALQSVMMQKLAEHAQLRKTQSRLKERGRSMLLHDAAILDSENPSGQSMVLPSTDILDPTLWDFSGETDSIVLESSPNAS